MVWEGAFFMLTIVWIIIAVSFDSLFVGMTYGMRKVYVPFWSMVVIMCMSAFVLMIAFTVGTWMEMLLPASFLERLGGIIFICIALLSFLATKNAKTTTVDHKTFVWEYLQEPTKVDFDHSGQITGMEAFFLSVALSLDAFGAGMASLLIGQSVVLIWIFIPIMTIFFLYVGMISGRFMIKFQWIMKLSFLPSIFFLILGLIRLI